MGLARRLALLPALLLAIVVLSRAVVTDESVRDWLVWRYFLYWGIAGVWVLACSSAGFAVLRRVLRSPLPLLEHWTMCFAVGLLAFFLLMFFGGLLGLYGSVFFVGILLALLGAGFLPLLRYLVRLRRHLRARAHRRVGGTAGVLLLWILGIIALFVFYLPGIVPAQIGYDSAWYHVPLGEHYARLGRIERLPEGWFPGAMPHLPSIVYCFAFLLPGGRLFDYVELASHLELATTLMALVGVPALVRRLARGARAHVAWIAFFAFPSVFYYAALIGGDQISALWGVPIALALLRTWPALSWRHGTLLACAVAGMVLTKYSASGILIGPALAIGARILWVLGRSLWQRGSLLTAWRNAAGGLLVGALILLLTTPLWAKNWIWYGDPFYPLLHRFFPSRPWSIDAATYLADFQLEMADYAPPPGWPGVKEGLWAVLDHGFKPADYSPLPLRGALFTLLCGCLPFVRASGRLWAVAGIANLAVFGWFMQLHQDRYLMAFLPIMAAVLAAVVVESWRSLRWARPLLIALCVLHSAWGLSIFSISGPNGNYRKVLDFAMSVGAKNPEAGMGDLARWDFIGRSLPAKSKVLVHGMHAHAGLGHPSISDWPRVQLGISYGRLASPAAVFAELKRMGVTHLVWQSETWPDDSYAGDLRFYEFARKYTSPKAVRGLWLGAMPSKSPPDTPRDPLVAFMSCDGRHAPGLYRLSSLTTPNPRGRAQGPYPKPLQSISSANADERLAEAHFAIYKSDCGIARPKRLTSDFLEIGRRAGYTLFARQN